MRCRGLQHRVLKDLAALGLQQLGQWHTDHKPDGGDVGNYLRLSSGVLPIGPAMVSGNALATGPRTGHPCPFPPPKALPTLRGPARFPWHEPHAWLADQATGERSSADASGQYPNSSQ